MRILMALLTLLFTPPQNTNDCTQIEALTGGVELEWIGYENGGWDLPSDLEMTGRINFAEGGLWEYQAESEPGIHYLWWFFDYTADGEPYGMHHFCAVKVSGNA